MRIYLSDSRSAVSAVARGLAMGRTVWCAETGEGWQMGGLLSLRHARNIARIIAQDETRRTFFYEDGES